MNANQPRAGVGFFKNNPRELQGHVPPGAIPDHLIIISVHLRSFAVGKKFARICE